MNRNIEILKEFQEHKNSLSATYLSNKFGKAIRTLQKDIKEINAILQKNGNCKIIQRQDKFCLVGHNVLEVINITLEKLLVSIQNNESRLINKMIIALVWNKKYLSNNELMHELNISSHQLRQYIQTINRYFDENKIILKILFKTKTGWFIQGQEKTIRFFMSNILVNEFKNSKEIRLILNPFLINLYTKVESLLVKNNLTNYFHNELICLLMVLIRRVKNDHHFFFNQEDDDNFFRLVDDDLKTLVGSIKNNFNVNINVQELTYLKISLLVTLKQYQSPYITKKIAYVITKINTLVVDDYNINDYWPKVKTLFETFLRSNWLKLFYQFSTFFQKISEKRTPEYLTNDWVERAVINKFSLTFQKIFEFKTEFCFTNLTQQIALVIENCEKKNDLKSWKFIFYLFIKDCEMLFSEVNNLILLIKNRYPNCVLKSLEQMNNDDWNLTNYNYSLVITNNNIEFKQSGLKIVKWNPLLSSKQVIKLLDYQLQQMMLNQVRLAIQVHQFFHQQTFSGLNSCLWYLQDIIQRKYQLHLGDTDLRNASMDESFLNQEILLMKDLIPINNIDTPIILIFFKIPLLFKNKKKIRFLFIFWKNKTNNLESWFSIWLNLFIKQVNPIIDNQRTLQSLINFSFKN